MSASWKTKPIDGRWRKVRLFVLQRDGYLCQIKGPKCTVTATQVDHIVGRGRAEDPAMLRAACAACNSRYRPPHDPDPEPRTRW